MDMCPAAKARGFWGGGCRSGGGSATSFSRYVAEASNENATKAADRSQTTAGVHDTGAARAGSNNRTFFVHWCGRRARTQGHGGGPAARDVCSDPVALMVSPVSSWPAVRGRRSGMKSRSRIRPRRSRGGRLSPAIHRAETLSARRAAASRQGRRDSEGRLRRPGVSRRRTALWSRVGQRASPSTPWSAATRPAGPAPPPEFPPDLRRLPRFHR